MTKSNYRKGDLNSIGQFVALPLNVLNSPDFMGLSASAIKLLFDVVAQFNGRNNGSLSPTWELMKKRSWKSPTTLNKAKEELRATRLITITKIGRSGINGSPELWAITWYKLDYRPDFDIEPKGHDFMGYLKIEVNPDAKLNQQAKKLVKTSLKAASK